MKILTRKVKIPCPARDNKKCEPRDSDNKCRYCGGRKR